MTSGGSGELTYTSCRLSPTSRLQLPPGKIHLWAVSLGEDINSKGGAAPELSALAVLSDDERARASSFCFQRDQERFCRTRAALRCLLSLYTDLEPGAIRFGYGAYGKPYLMPSAPGIRERERTLVFNVAHTGTIALLAFAENGNIGVDVEQADREADGLAIASRFFAEEEQEALRAARPADRERLFFEYWTLKEAVLKACGHGLTIPLSAFAVALRAGGNAQMLRAPTLPQSEGRAVGRVWTLLCAPPTPQYAAAIAMFGLPIDRVCCRWWVGWQDSPDAGPRTGIFGSEEG